jgi:hypothetical protein
MPWRVVLAYGESQAGNYASALAFACLLAMFPLTLAIVSLVGVAVRDPAMEARVRDLIPTRPRTRRRSRSPLRRRHPTPQHPRRQLLPDPLGS